MRLGFNVHNQVISRFDSAYVVADSRNFLTANFVFSTHEWSGKTKTAVFKQGDEVIKVILDRDDTCNIPWEVIRYPGFGVSVFAGDLITANIAQVAVTASGYTGTSGTPPPTPDVYHQIISLIDERRLVGPRGKQGKQGLPGPPGRSDPPEMRGLLSSKLLTSDEYSTEVELRTQIIASDEIDTHFSLRNILYGGWWDFDHFPAQVVTFSHQCESHWPHRPFAIPTDISDIYELSFHITDSRWWGVEYEVELLDVEPFTTVEGFDSYKINGRLTIPSLESIFDFSICLGFRLSAYEPTRAYILSSANGYPQSSIYFKRTSGTGHVLIHQLSISGGAATNTLPVGMSHRITFKDPLLEGERISTALRFPVTVKSPDLIEGKISLPFQASLLWASVGYVGIHTATTIQPEICCCPHQIHTEIEIDESGITATLVDRNQYENWWSETEISCETEVGYIEIISRRN